MHLKTVTNSTIWHNVILTKNKICNFTNLDPSLPTNRDLISLLNTINRPTVNKHNAAADAAVATVYKKRNYVIEILKERVLWDTTSTELMKNWEEIPNVNDLQLLQFDYIQGCW
jgi:hypothetical protein